MIEFLKVINHDKYLINLVDSDGENDTIYAYLYSGYLLIANTFSEKQWFPL